MVDVCWKDQVGRTRKATAFSRIFNIRRLPANGNGGAAGGGDPLGISPAGIYRRVRYCVYREIGYFVGVQFGPDTKWSEKTYRPEHLLDLQQLINRGKK